METLYFKSSFLKMKSGEITHFPQGAESKQIYEARWQRHRDAMESFEVEAYVLSGGIFIRTL